MLIDAGHIQAEVGEILAHTADGRTSPEQITLFKSVGVAVEDAAAATQVLDEALPEDIGTDLAP